MNICLAQTKSEKGNIKSNIENHLKWIDLAISNKADLIVFPELSLTGYEPELAKQLASDQNDPRLNGFQRTSDRTGITIGIGLPTKSDLGILITMVLIRPNGSKELYSKQKLHADERPYFVQASGQLILTIKETKIAPAICYESLQPEHAEHANSLGADIYLASVAKSQTGIDKAFAHFPKIAKKYAMPVLMANCVGFCDNFESAGQTSIWDKNGILIGQLDKKSEGILIFDTETNSSCSPKNLDTSL